MSFKVIYGLKPVSLFGNPKIQAVRQFAAALCDQECATFSLHLWHPGLCDPTYCHLEFPSCTLCKAYASRVAPVNPASPAVLRGKKFRRPASKTGSFCRGARGCKYNYLIIHAILSMRKNVTFATFLPWGQGGDHPGVGARLRPGIPPHTKPQANRWRRRLAGAKTAGGRLFHIFPSQGIQLLMSLWLTRKLWKVGGDGPPGPL